MGEVTDDNGWLNPPEAVRFDSMRYAKRLTEARLGRWTAKQTVTRISGIEPTRAGMRRVLIRNAMDGAPEAFIDSAPAPVTIAMTDRADWAVCAVIDAPHRVGCDLELVEPRSERFVRDYFTPAEVDAVLGGPGDTGLLANLVWSAKESALKVLRTGLRRDTRSVEVALEDGPAGSWVPLRVTAEEGRVFPGYWVRHGEFVLTLAAEVEIAPPISLVEPTPLATATPAHTWTQDPLPER
jgi:4'-phosphopantetheinyl transferase